MIKQSDIQEFVLSCFKNNADFKALCTSELGSELNLYKDSSIRDNFETLPCLIAHKLGGEENQSSPDEYITQFLVVASMPEETNGSVRTKPVLGADGVWRFGISDNVENVTIEAIDIIKCRLRDLGIAGEKPLYISKTSVVMSEIGEADDVMATVTMTIEKEKYLNP